MRRTNGPSLHLFVASGFEGMAISDLRRSDTSALQGDILVSILRSYRHTSLELKTDSRALRSIIDLLYLN